MTQVPWMVTPIEFLGVDAEITGSSYLPSKVIVTIIILNSMLLLIITLIIISILLFRINSQQRCSRARKQPAQQPRAAVKEQSRAFFR